MIIALEDAKYKLISMRADIDDLGSALRIDELKVTAEELDAQTLDPDFWSNQENSSKVLQKIKQTKDTIEGYESLKSRLEDAITLAEMAIEENDEAYVEEVQGELSAIAKEAEDKRIEILLSGEYDKNNAIVSFHPGAGGTEAQDWAQMLYRMITRWAERKGYKYKLIDWLDGDAAGIKSATIMVEGLNAYGYLKAENGVHRLVRVSPFDAAGRRQTSFASIEVMPEFDNIDKVEIRDEDIEVTAHRSSGAGGQHINKTDSAIRILHKPTGIVVECQEERSQFKNKDKALRMLRTILYDQKQREQADAIASDRRRQVGTGDRSERIRTYNFPQGRISDHRIGMTIYKLDYFLDGDIDEVVDALITSDQAEKMKNFG